MNTNRVALLSLFLLAVLLSACAPAASAEAPAAEFYAEPMVVGAPVVEESGKAFAGDSVAQGLAAPAEGEAVPGSPGIAQIAESYRDVRMIIKNAEIQLLVEDTDVALDRTTQVVDDLGGYIISSRIWYQTYYGENYKYATLTLGIPVEAFETTMRRLRGLAIRVLDENASGQDVTDQFVDLQSQLDNLLATRERVRGFLDQATTVEEALRVNQQLSELERQIEEIQGRMNYLQDRSAFSTITVTISPELPEIEPAPQPDEWSLGLVFDDAVETLTEAYRALASLFIWIVIVVVPVVGPFVLVLWGLWKLAFGRKAGKAPEPKSE